MLRVWFLLRLTTGYERLGCCQWRWYSEFRQTQGDYHSQVTLNELLHIYKLGKLVILVSIYISHIRFEEL
jgi:hypothetical protein